MSLVLGCGSGASGGASVVDPGNGGSSADPGGGGAAPNDVGAASGSTSDLFPMDPGGTSGTTNQPQVVEQNLIDFRIAPADLVLNVALGQFASLAFRAYGHFSSDPSTEVELTDRTVFYVPDNYLVAAFPADGSSTLRTRVPTGASDAQQRGGTLTVQAQAANSDGTITTATTSLTVKLSGAVLPASGSPEATPELPDAPSSKFDGAPTPARAPLLAYPNDGVLLPPNLGQLEVHFEPGAAENTLFQVEFSSTASDLQYYTRCYSDPVAFVPGACALVITGSDFENLASSNQGSGPVKLTVRGSDENGTFGEAASIDIEFAAQRIDGAVYYWTTSNQSTIERFDFGSGQSAAEAFVTPSDIPGNDGSCVGCHALSHQGDKIFFSLGNSDRGELMYVNDMSRSPSDPSFYTYNGAINDYPLPTEQRQNRVLMGSFNPDGSAFVAPAPGNDPAADQTLFFHDGTTGVRSDSVVLPFIPTQPDWSPDGDRIAMTAIGLNGATVSFLGGGISLITRTAGAWDAQNPVTIVPAEVNKNRFNPTFFPDGSLLLYSEVDQASYAGGDYANACNGTNPTGDGRFCNGYSDPAAKTWAVAPIAGASPVFLANAARPGVGDSLYPPPQSGVSVTDLMDTYPKVAPFLIEHRGKTIGWFTVGSQRRAGLRNSFPHSSVVGDPSTQALLWMFALDGSRVLAGEDGSYPGFFLPFQDLTTSNHMAQWTQRVVSASPPPSVPTPPAAPAPPPSPPAPPVIVR